MGSTCHPQHAGTSESLLGSMQIYSTFAFIPLEGKLRKGCVSLSWSVPRCTGIPESAQPHGRPQEHVLGIRHGHTAAETCEDKP